MSGAIREKTQADFDLERFIDMFDEAMTSQDPRVIETLRSLMMIVTLTRPEDHHWSVDRRTGPLRQMYDDVKQAHRRLSDVEDTLRIMTQTQSYNQANLSQSPEQSKYTVTAIAQQAPAGAISGGGAKAARQNSKWPSIVPLTLQKTS